MMRERGCRDIQLRNNVAHNHARRVGRYQQTHDAKTRLRTEGGEHIRKPYHLLFRLLLAGHRFSWLDNSIIMEISKIGKHNSDSTAPWRRSDPFPVRFRTNEGDWRYPDSNAQTKSRTGKDAP